MKWYRNRLTLVEVAPFGQESVSCVRAVSLPQELNPSVLEVQWGRLSGCNGFELLVPAPDLPVGMDCELHRIQRIQNVILCAPV
jgi:hypothetical protein